MKLRTFEQRNYLSVGVTHAGVASFIVGDGMTFKSKTEAETAMKTVKVCESL